MSRLAVFVVIVVVVAVAVSGYAVRASTGYHRVHDAAPAVAQLPAAQLPTGARIYFRHTGLDNRYGRVAVVPLDDPGGPRAFTGTSCDRVYADATVMSCLVTDPGVVTRYHLDEVDPDGSVRQTVSLPGIPSRTRLSPDGSLVSTTTFVSGHSYMQTGFSTATEIRKVGGAGYGNLEKFTLDVDGKHVAPTDRNLWGVSFVDDDTFYATLGTHGHTYLMRGDLADRTLTSVRDNAACPSVSPDGSHVAYKVDDDPGSGIHWSLAVLDLATGQQTVLGGEPASVDDQAEWLDDDTLLYGLPELKHPGVTDVWAIDTTADATPRLLIHDAWSPSVVRS